VIDILIPTYGRAERLPKVVANIQANTTVAHRVVFITEPEQPLELDLPGVDVFTNERTANYAGAINTVLQYLPHPYWFAGADDLDFRPGWDKAALDCMDDQTMVVGTNDLHNPFVLDGYHATHYLTDRRYVETYGGTLTEGPGVAFFEGYDHNYTDTEYIGVAKARARFKPCLTSVVEHMHHEFGQSQKDATYERGIRHRAEDEALYRERKKQWDSLVV
jgi:glycosyltransferase involved in cell wall biosynthesis